MKTLLKLTDKEFGFSKTLKRPSNYKRNKAVRAIFFNNKNKVAILHVVKEKYYKLPSGGLKRNESRKKALTREILEETGCTVEISREVGAIEEYYNKLKQVQTSYCYIGKKIGKAVAPKFTKEEISRGFKLQWMDIDTAIKKITISKPNFYRGNFIQKRDLILLKKAKQLFSRTKVLVVKHGETIQNAKKICTGHLNGKLSPKGIKQAKELAKKLKNKNITAIYSSDLKRSVDTANEILKFYPDLKLKTDKRLRERFFGKLQGKKFPKDLDWHNLPKDIETEKSMQVRADKFIGHIKKKHARDTVLIVCHDGIRASIISAILDKPVSWKSSTKKIIHEFELKQ